MLEEGEKINEQKKRQGKLFNSRQSDWNMSSHNIRCCFNCIHWIDGEGWGGNKNRKKMNMRKKRERLTTWEMKHAFTMCALICHEQKPSILTKTCW